MAAELVLQQGADEAVLVAQRERLLETRAALAEREAEVAQLRAQLLVFEGRYLRQVGVLYAELDELEARIAEREVALYDSDAARRRAEETRQQARESHEAAFGDAAAVEEVEPPPSLKALFREVAKRVHPDFARDEAELRHFTLLMASANQAYKRGDTETLQRLLDDHLEISSLIVGEDVASEILRILRQIRHAERDMAALDAEQAMMLAGEIGQLHRDAETAAGEHRDLLAELAARLREQVEDARRRFELIDRQIAAHGK